MQTRKKVVFFSLSFLLFNVRWTVLQGNYVYARDINKINDTVKWWVYINLEKKKKKKLFR